MEGNKMMFKEFSPLLNGLVCSILSNTKIRDKSLC